MLHVHTHTYTCYFPPPISQTQTSDNPRIINDLRANIRFLFAPSSNLSTSQNTNRGLLHSRPLSNTRTNMRISVGTFWTLKHPGHCTLADTPDWGTPEACCVSPPFYDRTPFRVYFKPRPWLTETGFYSLIILSSLDFFSVDLYNTNLMV